MSDNTYFKMNITMGDSVRDTDDLAQILMAAAASVANRMGEPGETATLRDDDGNVVGSMRFEETPDFRVGDKDTTGGTYGCYDGEYFYDEDGDTTWTCSREADHKGVHAAGNGSKIVATWETA